MMREQPVILRMFCSIIQYEITVVFMSAHLFLSVQWGYVGLCDYVFIRPVITVSGW